MIDIVAIAPDEESADIVVGCVGYEKRSAFHFSDNRIDAQSKLVLFDYAAEGLFAYSANAALAARMGARLHRDMADVIKDVVSLANPQTGTFVEIDVTSLDRGKLALLLSGLFQHPQHFSKVRLVYYPRAYTPPKYEFDIVNSFGPVLPQLMGNVALSRDELTVIVGAGYEYGRVVGALDTLEPGKVICFAPKGIDGRYDQAVMRANLEFAFLGKDEPLVWYALEDTFELFYNLRRIVELEAATGNVLILPLGPKLFAAIAMLIAFALHPSVSVWRHSTVSTTRPASLSDATATGQRITFSFVLRPPTASG